MPRQIASCVVLTTAVVAASNHERLVVIERGEGGFGVVTVNNVIAALKGRAASDSVLRVGEVVVSVDGEELRSDERLPDRIRAFPDKASFTLGVVGLTTPPPPPPTLPEMMRAMLGNPAVKKMVTKMAVGMATGGGISGGNLLEGAQQQALLGGAGGDAATMAQGQLALAREQQQQAVEVMMERQVGAMLDSPAFGSMMERVVESPAIQSVVRKAESGDLCADVDGFQATVACLLDGGLLRTVADATCDAMGVSASECEQVHAQVEAMLHRMGLRGDSWLGWLVRWLMLRPWQESVLVAALGVGALGWLLLWCCTGRQRRGRGVPPCAGQARARGDVTATRKQD